MTAPSMVLVELLGLELDHQHGFAGAGDDEVELRFRHLVDMRVEHVLAVDVADAGAADRAHEGNAGKRQRGRGGDHRTTSGLFSRSCCMTVMMTCVSFL